MLRKIYASGLVLAAAGAMLMPLSTASAAGLGFEGNYGHAEGSEGFEIGAGYAFNFGAFSLTPGGGIYLRDGDTDVYGRAEATVTLPMSSTFGVGLRVGNVTRPYATLAMPLLPKVAAKINVGPKYYTLGVKLGF